MEFGFVDYALAAFIIFIVPLWTVIDFRKTRGEIEAGKPGVRVRFYRNVIVEEWIVTAVLLALWVVAGRSATSLGLGLSTGTGFWIAGSAALVASGLLVAQAAVVRRSRERLAAVGKQIGSLGPVIPRDGREARWWIGVSVTAGICEEIVYRGFLIALFAAAIGTWPAVIASALVFGLAHIYQGPLGAFKAGMIGLVAGVLFVVTGSLWAPILLHVVLDLTSGYLARQALASGCTPAADAV